MKNKLTKLAVIISTIFAPMLSTAQGGPVGITYECYSGGVFGNCSWTDLIRAVQNFFNVIFPIVLGLSVIAIAYAGFYYMQSGANPGKRSEANRMLRYVAIGIFFMMAAWLIVNLITTTLIDPSFRSSIPIMQP